MVKLRILKENATENDFAHELEKLRRSLQDEEAASQTQREEFQRLRQVGCVCGTVSCVLHYVAVSCSMLRRSLEERRRHCRCSARSFSGCARWAVYVCCSVLRCVWYSVLRCVAVLARGGGDCVAGAARGDLKAVPGVAVCVLQ